MIGVFMTFSPTWFLLAFMCSHNKLTSSAKNMEKERAKA
jgi:hypothetical protein